MLILQSTTTSYSLVLEMPSMQLGLPLNPCCWDRFLKSPWFAHNQKPATLPITAMSAKWDIKTTKIKGKTECWSKKNLHKVLQKFLLLQKMKCVHDLFLRCWDDHFWFYLFQSMIAPAALSVQLVLATIYIQETVVLCNKKITAKTSPTRNALPHQSLSDYIGWNWS